MLVGREAAQGLQPTGMVVGVDEQLQVRPELFVGVVVVALDRGVLDGEPPRDFRRLQLLRGWSHDEAQHTLFA
jgi:hypothetical protein